MRIIRNIISLFLVIFIYFFALTIQFIVFILRQIIKLINHKSTKNEKAEFKSVPPKRLR
jgi:hypothetical protein